MFNFIIFSNIFYYLLIKELIMNKIIELDLNLYQVIINIQIKIYEGNFHIFS